MLIDRRNFMISTGAAGLVAMTEPVWAASGRGQEEYLWHEVSRNSVYIRDGNSKRVMYVLYAPWCPVCKALFERTRGRKEDVEIRWIPCSPTDERSAHYLVNACFTLSMRSLEATFAGKSVADDASPAFRRNAGTYQTYTGNSVRVGYKPFAGLGRVPGFPFSISRSADGGFTYFAGIPDDLDGFLSRVAEADVPMDDIAPAAKLLFAEYGYRPSRSRKGAYARKDDMKTYALPSRDALGISHVEKNHGGMVEQEALVGGEVWLGMRLFQFSGAFGKDALNWVPERAVFRS